MTQYPGTAATFRRRLANRLRAWMLSFSPSAADVKAMPGPRLIGSARIGRDMLHGHVKFAGRLVTAPGVSVWDIQAPDDAFRVDMHGFRWLDHLAAVALDTSVAVMQAWVQRWITLYGCGHGLAWSAEIVGQRQIRFLHHYDDLTRDLPDKDKLRLDQLLLRQGQFLARRWAKTPEGLPRLEALAALVLSARVMEPLKISVNDLARGIRREVTRIGDGQGGVPSRNPEELLYFLTLMVWILEDLTVMGEAVPSILTETIAKTAPVLRSLRHADGALARLQGSGAIGAVGLDSVLAASEVKTLARDGGMGFARLASGRTSVIVDADRPAKGEQSYDAHASTLAFEMTSGRRPLIVSCGSGAPFGPDWHKAGRATPSHSVLGLDGASSSRLGRARDILGVGREQIESRPSRPDVNFERHMDYIRLEASHDGYLRSHGVLAGRALELSIDGSTVAGEDVLLSEDRRARAKFDKLVESARQGLAFTIRFHLHPDVRADYDLEMNAFRLTLKSGEVWLFRHDGSCKMALESSVYLDAEAIKPTATKQIVLTGRAMAYATRIRWSLAKSPDSLKGLRDLAPLEAAPID